MTPRRRTTAFLLVTALLGGAAVVGYQWGSRPRSDLHRASIAEPPPASVILVTPEPGPLRSTLVYEVVLQRTTTMSVVLPAQSGVGRNLVSRVPGPLRGRLRAGDVIVEVSGSPVFALQGAVPAYRDLSLGMSGTDVRQLRGALCSAGSLRVGCRGDAYDSDLATAVSALYRAAGYPPVLRGGGASFPAAQIVNLAPLPAAIDRSAVVLGSPLPEAAVMIGSGSWSVAPAEGSVGLPPEGSGVLGDCPAAGVRITAGAVDRRDRARLAGFVDLRCTVEESAEIGLATDAVVPAAAIWTGPDGEPRLTVRQADGAEVIVAVTVLGEREGAAVVRGAGSLDDGQMVRVPVP